jgi:flagellar hook-associated protein 1 FlgK
LGVDLLSVAKSGLFASKKSLETTGHNIANVNTEGFSRQKVRQVTNAPIPAGGLVYGSGTRVTGINRIHDHHLEKRLRDQHSSHDFFKSRADKLGQVEDIFNEIDTEGLNKVVNKLFNSFRELANQPENETIRSIVRENAKLVVKDFRRIKDTLREMGNQIGYEVRRGVEEINQLTRQISKYNKQIADLEGVNGETGDIRDKRDLAVKDLAKYFKLHTYSDEQNQFVVQVEGLGSLVSGPTIQELRANSAPRELSSNGLDGQVEVFLANRPSYPVSLNIESGSFTAMFKSRNEDIKNLMDRIDELAFNVANSVNAVHRRGYINKPVATDQNGNPLANDRITGINFFGDLTSVQDAADKIDISFEVKTDLNNLTTALAPNRPGDNRVAIAISKLQHEKMLADGTKTLEEHYLESIGQIGLAASKANLDYEQSEGILAQINSLKERVSGVSLDEEAANLVKFQQAYDASAKVLATADEMFRTVLGIMPR